jgi:fructokinase
MTRYGLVEAGGTKIVVGVAAARDDIRATQRIPTTTPAETIGRVIEWLKGAAAKHGPLGAIGVASFGPLDLDPVSPTWGHITRTTKPGWDHTDVAGPLAEAFDCPIGFDTDVNGAALAESIWGASQGQRVSLYLTIGTGIGGGAIVSGETLRGLSHPEMGHILLAPHPDELGFAGSCPFHGRCLEGLASGPAIKARWGKSLSELAPDHPGHAMISWYLAQAICSFQSILEPGRIVMGGGVMATPGLLGRVIAEAQRLGKGYFKGDPADIVCPPGLGDQSGLLGALALAQRASHLEVKFSSSTSRRDL